MRFCTSSALSLIASLALVGQTLAGHALRRADGTLTSTLTSTTPAAGLVGTTINGTKTTLQVVAPTGDATATGKANAGGTETSPAATSTSSFGAGDMKLLQCNAPTGNPMCMPSNATILYVGDTYYVTWDPTRFDVNATINILLNYSNDTARAAYTSEGIPKQKGFLTVTMQESWMQESSNATLIFALVSYTPVSDHTARPFVGPTVFLSKKPATHYSPPPVNTLPDNRSLLIGLPLGLGALFFVMLGLFFGMRRHRKVSITEIRAALSKRRGYGASKSKRQRLGLKKGAIRLEEREVMTPNRREYTDDEVRSVPPRMYGGGYRSEESLGSLVSDNEGPPGHNAFRDEIRNQQRGAGY
ncbi:hypothetical protein E2P81_ATG02426 [Venturia nashicola]|uniref:Gb n=1 Tax=Venturia nashicola TaxID=86259 RepID=A0A4Z1PKX0_9PEZI|nr:hypothetical protein E6O75_ATG02485 [Venturia nashicola]TLD36644.1 hypothetical protein E2P81_ATG02426 [Venturia nashicola]